MRRYKNRLIVLGLLACAIAPAAAENLLDIYELARQYDPVLREAEARYLARLQAKPQARSAMLPSLSLGVGSSTSS